jgi:hypothetical protein
MSKSKKPDPGCPLELSVCYEKACRYWLESRCQYAAIKAYERRKAAEADGEMQSPARRLNGQKVFVRMEIEK